MIQQFKTGKSVLVRSGLAAMAVLGLLLNLAVADGQQDDVPVVLGGEIDGLYELSIPTRQVVSGSVVSLPVEVQSESVSYVSFTCSSDPGSLQIMGMTLGQGMENYLAENNEPPICDIVIFPDSAMAYLYMIPTYETVLYGAEFMRLHCYVSAPPGSTVNVVVSSFLGGEAEIEIEVIVKKDLRRGDTNGDGVCNIADAVKLLNILFNNDQNACSDSADSDDNGQLEITDAILLLQQVFGTTEVIDDGCATDVTPDDLADCFYTACG